jgi:hypothetical protein
MELRIHIIGLLLWVACITKTESHPRHESRLQYENKVLTLIDDKVVRTSSNHKRNFYYSRNSIRRKIDGTH